MIPRSLRIACHACHACIARMNRGARAALVALAACAAAIGVVPEAAAQLRAPDRGVFVWSAGIGGFSGENNPGKLNNQSSEYFAFGGFGWRPHPNFVLEAELPFFGQRYDTPANIVAPPAGTVDGRVTINTFGLALGGRFIVPLGRVELSVGGGGGVYRSRFRATGTSFGLPAELTRDDNGTGAHVKAGLDFYLTRNVSLGVEYRRLWLESDFGSVSRGSVDLGGNFYYVTVRGLF